ncbi:amidohydrolase family protein [Gangjinia marincola]
MKTRIYILVQVVMFCGLVSFAQQTPAPKQIQAVTIMNATAHIGNGEVIENSIIMFENGKISFIGDATTVKIEAKGEIINAAGKHVYPGIIAPNSTLGLVEIGAVRQTNDDGEIGGVIPHVRGLIAYNSESQVVESMRPNGVLIGQITPRDGVVAGTSSIVQFDAWNWEDAVIKEDDGIHLNWPNSVTRGRWWMGEDPGYKANDKYKERIATIEQVFKTAKAYLAGSRSEKDLQFEAMAGLFDKSQKLYVNVSGEREILDAIAFKKEYDVDMVVIGGYDAHKVADQLKANNIPVLLKRVHTTPQRDDEDYDLPYKLAKMLVDKGVLVALQNAGQMERANARNLPFQAGQTMSTGLTAEQALMLITSNPAKILGIDDRLGTLEKGKDATLFISEGNALDMRTNQLTRAFIEGRDISLETHQTTLAKRYSDKYEGQKKEK